MQKLTYGSPRKDLVLAHAVEHIKGLPSPNGIIDISLDITLGSEQQVDLKLCSTLDNLLSNEEKFPSIRRLKVSNSLCLHPFVILNSRRKLRYIPRSNWADIQQEQLEMRSPGVIKENRLYVNPARLPTPEC